MTKRHRPIAGTQASLGKMLIALGVALFLASLSYFSVAFEHLLTASGATTLGPLPALGVAFLYSARTVLFEPTSLLFFVLKILVSFSPFALILIGALVLRRARRAAASRSTGSEPDVTQDDFS